MVIGNVSGTGWPTRQGAGSAGQAHRPPADQPAAPHHGRPAGEERRAGKGAGTLHHRPHVRFPFFRFPFLRFYFLFEKKNLLSPFSVDFPYAFVVFLSHPVAEYDPLNLNSAIKWKRIRRYWIIETQLALKPNETQ